MKFVPLSWTDFSERTYIFGRVDDEDVTVVVDRDTCYFNNNSTEMEQSSLVRNCQHLCVGREHLENMKVDRTSPIAQLLKTSQIRPYEEVEITSYKFDEETGFYHARPRDLKPVASAGNTRAKTITMYFDIEVVSASRSFPDANLSDSEIRIITVILFNGETTENYVLATTQNALTAFSEKYPDVHLALSDNQHDLLVNFYALWSYAAPNYVIHYNGYSFDTPFIVRKTQMEDVDVSDFAIGRLANPTGRIVVAPREYINNIGKAELTYTWVTPGVTEIDLLPYFRRFYPNIANYRLDTVARHFLGVGKTGLGIEEMMSIIEQDSDEMSTVIEYAFVDTLRLYELDRDLKVLDHLKQVANASRVTIEQLLTSKDQKLLQHVLYNLDHAVLCRRIIYETVDFVVNPAVGIMLDAYVYDYRRVILEALKTLGKCELPQLTYAPKTSRFAKFRKKTLVAPDEFCTKLYERIIELPIQLIIRLLYSNYGPINAKNAILTVIINLIEDRENILAINETSVVTMYPLADELFTLIRLESARIAFTETSYATFDGSVVSYHGFSEISNPPFAFIRQLTDNYVVNVVDMLGRYRNGEIGFDDLAQAAYELTKSPEISTIEMSELMSKVRIRPYSYYANKRESIAKRVSAQYSALNDADFVWKYATYFMTHDGLHLVDFDGYPGYEELNTSYYLAIISRVLRALENVTEATLNRLK